MIELMMPGRKIIQKIHLILNTEYLTPMSNLALLLDSMVYKYRKEKAWNGKISGLLVLTMLENLILLSTGLEVKRR